MRGERDDGGAFRLDAGNLAIAKRVRAGRALEGDRKHEPARQTRAPGKELFDRHVTRTVAALHRDGCVEREQRDGKIPKWCWREQIAAARAHVAHPRPADRPTAGMEQADSAPGNTPAKRTSPPA